MVKIWHGTSGNDVLTGSMTDANIFDDVGLGRDVAIGGPQNDIFNMLVDEQVDLVDGGAGEDTINYSAADRGLVINLATGDVTATFNSAFFLVTHEVTEVKNIEDVVGSRFNDTIIGTAGNNRLDGGDGNDTIHAGAGNDTLIGGLGTNVLDGGTGIDTADYSSAGYRVYASLANGIGYQLDSTGGTQAVDTYLSIENLNGSSHDDILIGDSNANVINGNDGNDLLMGGGGGDTLNGGAGDDMIYSGQGADRLDGGSGINTLNYSSSTQGVSVNLATSAVSGGDAAGDIISNFQNVIGSANGNDILTGSDGNNTLYEQTGINMMTGGAGQDTFAFNAQLSGVTTVADFHIGEDRLAIIGNDTMQNLHFLQAPAGTIITLDNASGSILLAGVNAQTFMQHASTGLVFSQTLDPLLHG